MAKKIFTILFFLIINLIESEAENFKKISWEFSVKGPQTNIQLTTITSLEPAIIWEDVSCQGLPVTDVKIGGLQIGKKILSGSRVILYPDRLGIWEYDFGMRRIPDEYFELSDKDKTEYLSRVYPYNKRLNDTIEPFNHVIVRNNDLKISFYHRRITRISYFVNFGDDFAVSGLLVWPWDYHHEDGTGAGASGVWTNPDEKGQFAIDIVISEDPEGKKVIAERSCNEDEIRKAGLGTGGPFYLPLPDVSSFYITIRLSKGKGAYLAGGHFRGFLRYKGNNWPIFKEGENTIIYSEGTSGGKRSLIFYEREILLPGFSGSLEKLDITTKNCTVEKIKPEGCQASYLNNTGILRVSPDENFLKAEKFTRGFYFTINLQEPINLKNIKAIRIIYRVPTACGRLQITARGIWGDREVLQLISMGAPPIVPDTKQPITFWTTYEKKIPSPENMSKIISFTINSWGPSWALPENDKFCIEIGGIEFIPFDRGEKEKEEKEKQEKIMWEENSKGSPIYQKLKKKPLPSGKKINPREIFARGIYAVPGPLTTYPEQKFGCKEIWEYWEKIMDDLKAHHLNALHISCYGDQGEVMENFVKLADEKGFYLWGAGPLLLTREQTVLKNEWQSIKEELKKRLLKWKDVPTFLAWAITEEPEEWQIPYMKEARKIMSEIGSQSQIIIYNKPDVLLKDIEYQPYPAGLSMDSYPFYVWGTRTDRYLDFLKTTWEGTKKIGGVAWFVPQLVENGTTWRALTQAEVRFQIWTGIAYNIKGFFPFLYQAVKNDDFTNKPSFNYYTQEMARIEKLEKVLVAMERDDDLTLLYNNDESKFIIGSFTDRDDKNFRFAVVVNLSISENRDFFIKPNKETDRVIHIIYKSGDVILKEVEPHTKINIAPGDGQIFFVGSIEKSKELARKYFPSE